MRALWAVYIATIREFARDTTALFWMVAFPILFILIFGVIFSEEDAVTFDIGVVNQDGASSAQLVDALQSVNAFNVTTSSDPDAERQQLKDGDRNAVIVIPDGTGAALGTYFANLSSPEGDARAVPLEVYYDPADRNTSQIMLSVINQVVASMSAEASGVPPALVVDSISVTRSSVRYIDYLLPGVLALNLMQLGLFGTAEPLVSLREKGVLKRMGATPLTKSMLLASQVLYRLTITVITTLLIIIVGKIAFDVTLIAENILATAAIVLLGSSMFITLGYALSGMARTENAVQGVTMLPYFIMMFLSGIFFPMEMMPAWIRPLVDALPLTYLGDALRKTMLDAGSYYSMTRNVAIMAAWLVVCALFAVRLFKWEPQA